MDQFDIELAEASEQRSQIWRDARCGKFTASEIYKLMTEPRNKADKEAGKFSQGAMTYIKTKVAEELTGLVHQDSNAYPLVYGQDMEVNAKEYLREVKGYDIKEVGFVAFTDHAGGSPDGHIGEDEVLEIKCPFNSANHVEYLMMKTPEDLYDFKPEYYYQIQANVLFAKRKQGRFVSFDPRMPDKHKLYELIIPAHVGIQHNIAERLGKAIEEKLKIINLLNGI
jgi:hypothetical protein